MSVAYKDYYKILGVARTATQDEISKAFKKLARKYHPDLNPGNPEAETKFKEMGEANEVLKDPEKRKLYDQLGANWQQGQNFQPPPGFENMHFQFTGGGPGGGMGGGFGGGGFSDFFETLFGGAQGGPRGGFGGGFGGGQHMRARRGQDAEVSYEIGLEQAYSGGPQSLSLQEQAYGPDGRPMLQTKTLKVNLPPGVKDGQKIRLSGQGSPGLGGGEAGDLYLKIRLAPHPQFKVKDDNVILDLHLTPWEAALGATVRVPTLDGAVEMKIPPGISSGARLRVRGKGLGPAGRRGDQMVRIMIQTPKELTDEERQLWEKMAQTSSFKPRD